MLQTMFLQFQVFLEYVTSKNERGMSNVAMINKKWVKGYGLVLVGINDGLPLRGS